jgi:hypothetical protein
MKMKLMLWGVLVIQLVRLHQAVYVYEEFSTIHSANSLTKISGKLVQISSGGMGFWGLSSDDHIWYWKAYVSAPTHAYQHIDGGLHAISAGTHTVWGVSSDGLIWLRTGITPQTPTGNAWVQIAVPAGKKGKDVAVEDMDRAVWLTDTEGGVYFREGISHDDHKGTGWKKIDGACQKDITVGPNGMFCVNSADEVWQRSRSEGGKIGNGWELDFFEGRLVQLSDGNGYLWGVNKVGELWRRDIACRIDVNSCWKKYRTDVKWKHVSCNANGVLAAVDVDMNIYFEAVTGADELKKLPRAKLVYFSVGGLGFWGTNKENVMWFKENADRSPWATNTARNRVVSAGTSTLWGVNKDGQVWMVHGITPQDRHSVNWIHIANPSGVTAKDVSVSDFDDAVWMIDVNGVPYFRTGVTHENPKGTGWEKIDGQCKLDISVGTSGMWCINDAAQIWHRQGTVGTNNKGTGWKMVGDGGRLSQLSVGNGVIWGVNSAGDLWRRMVPNGSPLTDVNEWKQFRKDVKWQHVSVTHNGEMAATDIDDNTYLF